MCFLASFVNRDVISGKQRAVHSSTSHQFIQIGKRGKISTALWNAEFKWDKDLVLQKWNLTLPIFSKKRARKCWLFPYHSALSEILPVHVFFFEGNGLHFFTIYFSFVRRCYSDLEKIVEGIASSGLATILEVARFSQVLYAVLWKCSASFIHEGRTQEFGKTTFKV